MAASVGSRASVADDPYALRPPTTPAPLPSEPEEVQKFFADRRVKLVAANDAPESQAIVNLALVALQTTFTRASQAEKERQEWERKYHELERQLQNHETPLSQVSHIPMLKSPSTKEESLKETANNFYTLIMRGEIAILPECIEKWQKRQKDVEKLLLQDCSEREFVCAKNQLDHLHSERNYYTFIQYYVVFIQMIHLHTRLQLLSDEIEKLPPLPPKGAVERCRTTLMDIVTHYNKYASDIKEAAREDFDPTLTLCYRLDKEPETKALANVVKKAHAIARKKYLEFVDLEHAVEVQINARRYDREGYYARHVPQDLKPNQKREKATECFIDLYNQLTRAIEVQKKQIECCEKDPKFKSVQELEEQAKKLRDEIEALNKHFTTTFEKVFQDFLSEYKEEDRTVAVGYWEGVAVDSRAACLLVHFSVENAWNEAYIGLGGLRRKLQVKEFLDKRPIRAESHIKVMQLDYDKLSRETVAYKVQLREKYKQKIAVDIQTLFSQLYSTDLAFIPRYKLLQKQRYDAWLEIQAIEKEKATDAIQVPDVTYLSLFSSDDNKDKQPLESAAVQKIYQDAIDEWKTACGTIDGSCRELGVLLDRVVFIYHASGRFPGVTWLYDLLASPLATNIADRLPTFVTSYLTYSYDWAQSWDKTVEGKLSEKEVLALQPTKQQPQTSS